MIICYFTVVELKLALLILFAINLSTVSVDDIDTWYIITLIAIIPDSLKSAKNSNSPKGPKSSNSYSKTIKMTTSADHRIAFYIVNCLVSFAKSMLFCIVMSASEELTDEAQMLIFD